LPDRIDDGRRVDFASRQALRANAQLTRKWRAAAYPFSRWASPGPSQVEPIVASSSV